MTPLLLSLYSPSVYKVVVTAGDYLLSIYQVHIKPRSGSIPMAELDKYIRKAGFSHGVDPLLVKAVIKVESNFDHDAVSPKGARGLMQLMPDTAKHMSVKDPNDPWENINGGAKYLAWLLKIFKGDLRLTLAAYNAGPKTVRRCDGVPPYPETKRFIRQVMRNYTELRGEDE